MSNSFDESRQQKLMDEIQQAENFVRPRMSRDALERYGRIKFGQPQKALQALVLMAQMLDSGKIQVVSDEDLKKILLRMVPKRTSTIIRK
jgi:DNA-binding TFAR19-related protein (PDSD5 family)